MTSTAPSSHRSPRHPLPHRVAPAGPTSFGDHLRTWRQQRHLSQLELADEADISTRHVSFMETGRTNPSRDMVLRLCERLAIPLRERNALLVAAGYAPMYRERALDDPALAAARQVSHGGEPLRLLEGFDPGPLRALLAALAPKGGEGTKSTLTLDLTLNAPNGIFVRGRGIDAELGGNLTIRGTASDPVVSGGFDMRRGRIVILSKRLDFTSGKITFGGSLIPDTLKGSISTLFGTYDGNVDNQHNGQEVNGYNHRGVRGKLEFTPNDDVTFTLIADYMQSHDDAPNGVVSQALTPAFASALSPVRASSDNRKINTNTRTHVEDVNKGLSGQLDWQFGDYTLTSITAYDYIRQQSLTDADYTPYEVNGASITDNSYRQWSQEFRLASPEDRPLHWLLPWPMGRRSKRKA